MLRSYFKIAFRNLIKNKGYTFINITGLATGMAVALLIGLWIWDELTFNRYHNNYDRLAQVWQNNIYNGVKQSQISNPYVMAEEIRNNFGGDFKYVIQSSWNFGRILTVGEKKFNKAGMYWEPEVIDMLSINLLKGNPELALKDPYSIILSESVAKTFFGNADPIGQTMDVSHQFGKTVGWQFKDGRDFSREFASDSSAFVINEAAEKFLGFENAVGETLTWNERPYTIIGVIKDMVIESPYAPVRPSLWHINRHEDINLTILKLNPEMSPHQAIEKIKTVYNKYSPASPFSYDFVDVEYARKFSDEERIGKLASFFALLAVFISCLGISGLASFVAEQRTKEIGVRKVMGASVMNLWGMLSKDFLRLVVFSLLLAMPIAWYLMSNWLEKYDYRSTIAWWIFAAAGVGALAITLLTVSYQSIKAAMANPVNSLRSE